jgi:hypothetical protein
MLEWFLRALAAAGARSLATITSSWSGEIVARGAGADMDKNGVRALPSL